MKSGITTPLPMATDEEEYEYEDEYTYETWDGDEGASIEDLDVDDNDMDTSFVLNKPDKDNKSKKDEDEGDDKKKEKKKPEEKQQIQKKEEKDKENDKKDEGKGEISGEMETSTEGPLKVEKVVKKDADEEPLHGKEVQKLKESDQQQKEQKEVSKIPPKPSSSKEEKKEIAEDKKAPPKAPPKPPSKPETTKQKPQQKKKEEAGVGRQPRSTVKETISTKTKQPGKVPEATKSDALRKKSREDGDIKVKEVEAKNETGARKARSSSVVASSVKPKAVEKPKEASVPAKTKTSAEAPQKPQQQNISGRSLGRFQNDGKMKPSAERARSVSPVKSVRDIRKTFGNPEAPPLIINNVPRGNILARFGISQLPRNVPPPQPPPKREFKWKLPEISAAAKSTYMKPKQKPTVYMSSAPEFKNNPLAIQPSINITVDPELPPTPTSRIFGNDEEGEAKDELQKDALEKPKALAAAKTKPAKQASAPSTKAKTAGKPVSGVKKGKEAAKPKVAATKKADAPKKKAEAPKKSPTEVKPKPTKAPAAPKKLQAKAAPPKPKPKPTAEKSKEEKGKEKASKKEEKPVEEVTKKEIAEEKTEEEEKKVVGKEGKDEKKGKAANDEYEYEYEYDEEGEAEEEKGEQKVETQKEDEEAIEEKEGEEEEGVEVDEEEADEGMAVEGEEEEGAEDEETVVEEGEDEEEKVVDEDEEEMEDEEKENQRGRSRRKRGKRGRKTKKNKEKALKEKKPREKRKWVRPERPAPELVEMPPQAKRLFEMLREENIRPTVRYSKKAKKEVEIPFILPWENLPSLQSQTGMGAFGTHRDPNIKVEEGEKKLVQGSLKSETLLTLFEENLKNYASQKGLGPFGARRKNIGQIVDSHEYESEDKIKLSESIIPMFMQGLLHSQSEITPIGALRSQTTKTTFKGEIQDLRCEPESHEFLSRQFKPNNPLVAGSCLIDKRRNQISLVDGLGEMKCHQFSQGFVPKIYSTDDINTKRGADFGAFRPVIQGVEGGYNMDYDQERRCKLVIPFQTGQSLAP